MKNLISFSIIALLAFTSITAINNFSKDDTSVTKEVLAELEISPDSFLLEMDLSEDELRRVSTSRSCYSACWNQYGVCISSGFSGCLQQYYDCIDFCNGHNGET